MSFSEISLDCALLSRISTNPSVLGLDAVRITTCYSEFPLSCVASLPHSCGGYLSVWPVGSILLYSGQLPLLPCLPTILNKT